MDTGSSILAAILLLALLVSGVVAMVTLGWNGDLSSIG